MLRYTFINVSYVLFLTICMLLIKSITTTKKRASGRKPHIWKGINLIKGKSPINPSCFDQLTYEKELIFTSDPSGITISFMFYYLLLLSERYGLLDTLRRRKWYELDLQGVVSNSFKWRLCWWNPQPNLSASSIRELIRFHHLLGEEQLAQRKSDIFLLLWSTKWPFVFVNNIFQAEQMCLTLDG